MARVFSPVVLDCREPDDVLRAQCEKPLRDSLTPVIALSHHGCEDVCAALVAASKESHAPPDAAQAAYEFDGGHPLHTEAEAAKTCLMGLALRMMRVLAGDDIEEKMAERGCRCEGRLKMRTYPRAKQNGGSSWPAQRLGAHCDATLMTLLWTDAPGLQVVDPKLLDAAEWTPQQITSYGLPTMGPPPPELKEADWATVKLESFDRGILVMTLGTGWSDCGAVMQTFPARSAALHRVMVHRAPAADRHSLPFFLDAVPVQQ
jgi:isopenicillin N synthase-like dioxygenase